MVRATIRPKVHLQVLKHRKLRTPGEGWRNAAKTGRVVLRKLAKLAPRTGLCQPREPLFRVLCGCFGEGSGSVP